MQSAKEGAGDKEVSRLAPQKSAVISALVLTSAWLRCYTQSPRCSVKTKPHSIQSFISIKIIFIRTTEFDLKSFIL